MSKKRNQDTQFYNVYPFTSSRKQNKKPHQVQHLLFIKTLSNENRSIWWGHQVSDISWSDKWISVIHSITVEYCILYPSAIKTYLHHANYGLHGIRINNCHYRWLPSLECTCTWTFLNIKKEAHDDLCGGQKYKMAPKLPGPWCACPWIWEANLMSTLLFKESRCEK